ncbi:DUF4149 domain-containing protein [Mycena chlorophos]|uniref:DUF4149 domain-containing protein n=1 Tax=Mycena chlorophos TaxID=658473 RepID=A0A8H6W9D7_MYCCL|nr:DUF4149 domain-containing protein [Mycena chlorophos]
MTAAQLSVGTLMRLFSVKGGYLLGFSFLYGMSVWVTLFGGVIAFKTLSRPQFGALQHKTFPIYFALSMAITSYLIVAWVSLNPNVLKHVANPLVPEVAQAYTLASAILMQASNYFIVGPLTSKTMFQRAKLEKDEGKSYSDAGVSDQMKALNKRFGMLHGISSLANLGSVIALTFHGLWIGSLLA